MADVEDGTKSGLNIGLHNGLKFQIPRIRSHLNNSNRELGFDAMKYLSFVGCRICYQGLHTVITLCSITLICNCYNPWCCHTAYLLFLDIYELHVVYVYRSIRHSSVFEKSTGTPLNYCLIVIASLL